MRTLKNILLSTLIATTFFGCETEVDIFSDHVEKAVVFALLNPADSIQYFRINPTFVGDGSASEIAKDPTITNYGPGEIKVQLINLTDPTKEPYDCKETTDIPLDPDGIFSSENRLYYLDTKVTVSSNGNITNEVLEPGHTFQLLITKVSTGEIYFGQTTIPNMNLVKLTKPSNSNLDTRLKWMDFHSGQSYIDYSFIVSEVLDIYRYTLEMKYYFTEQGDDPESKAKFVQMDIGEVRPEDATSAELSIDFKGERFYSILSTSLTGLQQLSGQRADVYVTSIGKELDAYLSVQDASSNSITPEQTPYSNIVNGIGIFSVRSTKVFPNILINELSANHVLNGAYTINNFECARYGATNNSQGPVKCK